MAVGEIIGESLPLLNSLTMSIFVASAFIIGSLVAIKIKYSPKIKGDFAAIAAGTFFGAIAFSLINESLKIANINTMILGFILGAAVYSIVNHYIRKRSKYKTSSFRIRNKEKNRNNDNDNTKAYNNDSKQGGTSTNIIIGTILDSIPETLFIGVIIAMQLHGLIGAVITLFLGNFAATLSGAKLMVEKGISKSKIIKEWTGDFALVAAAGPIGYYLVKPLSVEYLSIIIGFAAGTLMIFISRELIPQAYKEDTGYLIDISLVSGFLIAFLLFHYL